MDIRIQQKLVRVNSTAPAAELAEAIQDGRVHAQGGPRGACAGSCAASSRWSRARVWLWLWQPKGGRG